LAPLFIIAGREHVKLVLANTAENYPSVAQQLISAEQANNVSAKPVIGNYVIGPMPLADRGPSGSARAVSKSS
jgi:hypothetical protein